MYSQVYYAIDTIGVPPIIAMIMLASLFSYCSISSLGCKFSCQLYWICITGVIWGTPGNEATTFSLINHWLDLCGCVWETHGGELSIFSLQVQRHISVATRLRTLCSPGWMRKCCSGRPTTPLSSSWTTMRQAQGRLRWWLQRKSKKTGHLSMPVCIPRYIPVLWHIQSLAFFVLALSSMLKAQPKMCIE